MLERGFRNYGKNMMFKRPVIARWFKALVVVFFGLAFFVVANSTQAQISPADWSQVNSNGFNGDVNNSAVDTMAVFSNKLYVGVRNTTTGAEIWSSSNGTTWSEVIGATGGFGDETLRNGVGIENWHGVN